MGRRGDGEGSIQRPSLRHRLIRQHPFFPCLQHVPNALRGDFRGLEASRAKPRFKDAYKATARTGESVRRLPIERFISQAELSKLAGDWPAHLRRTGGDERAPHLFAINKIPKALGVEGTNLYHGRPACQR
jgi:hypothetical protein